MNLKQLAALCLGMLALAASGMPVGIPPVSSMTDDRGIQCRYPASRRNSANHPLALNHQLGRRRFKWHFDKHCIDKVINKSMGCTNYEPGYDPNLPEDEDY